MSLPPGNDAAAGLRRLLLNGSYQGLANAYYVFVRGIYVIVFARVLGVEAYGQYLYAQSWSGLALGIAVWGLNELALAEYAKSGPQRGARLLAEGFGLRLAMSALLGAALVPAALVFEPDPLLRLLIMVYALGVLARGAASWFQALFIIQEQSRHWLLLSVLFLTLEVAAAVLLAVWGNGLVAIALAQCAIWWLQFLVTWWVYESRFAPMRPALGGHYWRFYLGRGAGLALATTLLAFMANGLLILYRFISDDGRALGEAAFALQLLVIAGYMIKLVSNTALPSLSRPTRDRQPREIFFTQTLWRQAMYLGGAAYLLCELFLPLAVHLLGADFDGAVACFAGAGWLLVPLLLIYGFRLLLISRLRIRAYLSTLVLGLGVLAGLLQLLAGLGAVNPDRLLLALGAAYCVVALAMLALVQAEARLLGVGELLVPLLLLLACVAASQLAASRSLLLAAAVGVLPLLLLAAGDLRRGLRQFQAT